MKRGFNVMLLMSAILLIGSGSVFAVLPDPLVAIDFNGNWKSSGSAGTDMGTVVEQNGITPQFGVGVLTECFDQTAGEFDQVGGAVVFGDTLSQTPVQSALSGLVSFTITALIKMPAGVYGDPNHLGTVLFSALDENGDHAIAVILDQWNRLTLVVNNQIETDPFGGVGIHWLSPFTEDRWAFFSFSYDGTVDSGSDPFDVQNVVCHSGMFTDVIHPRPVQNTSYNGVLFAGAVNDVSGLVWIGNTADTAARWAYDAVEQGIVFGYDPGYPATFAGKLEALRIYGSKTDASGVLAKDQIETIRSDVIANVCGGYNNPIPLGDLTGDCQVDMDDYAKLANNWMTDIRP